MRRTLAITIFLLLIAGVILASDQAELVRRIIDVLAEQEGFDATYLAESASGREITIRILYAQPNRMKMSLTSLGAVTLFDGEKYLYYDKEREKAVVMEAKTALNHLAAVHRTLGEIPWVDRALADDLVPSVIYPRLMLDLNHERLDLSLEMSTQAHRHSWVRLLAAARSYKETYETVTINEVLLGHRREIAIDLQTGLLQSIVVKSGGEKLGSLHLKKLKREKPDDQAFVFNIPEGTEVRDQKQDPSLLQQLLVTGFRTDLEQILVVAKRKWASLNEQEKQALRKAVHGAFVRVFSLSEDAVLQQMRKSLRDQRFINEIRQAYRNEEKRREFAADHPDMEAEEFETAWRKQIISEAEYMILSDIMKTIDREIVQPIRAQAWERTIGMDENDRKQLVLSITEPILQSFREMVSPTIQGSLREVLN